MLYLIILALFGASGFCLVLGLCRAAAAGDRLNALADRDQKDDS
jgi:hypothetical protein